MLRSIVFRPAALAAWSTAAFFASAALPASADLPVSVSLGPQFTTGSNAQIYGGSTQIGFGAAYDVIHAPVVPIAASLAFDYAHGSNGSASLDELGFGADARLTTPLYVGAGFRVVSTNASGQFGAEPLEQRGITTTSSFTGIGEDFFLGDRFLSLPGGVNFSLQATYRQLPSFDGINPSNIGVGLRVQL